MRNTILTFTLLATSASAQWPTLCAPGSAWNATRCPSTQSCQPNGFSVTKYGCCPYPTSVSCGDYACCPGGSTCVPVSGSGYGAVFKCVSPTGPATTSRCPCKPGMALPMSTTLKNVLVIGDSLSIGYTPYVATALADIALVQHAPWDVSDGGAEEAAYFGQCLENWLHSPSGIPVKVDAIWFNSGMHNLETDGSGVPGQSGTAAEYGGELANVTARLVAYAAATGTKLIYGLTTPYMNNLALDTIITGTLNVNASSIMARAGIPVVDLHSPIVNRCGAVPQASCEGQAGCWSPHCPPGYSWLTDTVIAPALRALLG